MENETDYLFQDVMAELLNLFSEIPQKGATGEWIPNLSFLKPNTSSQMTTIVSLRAATISAEVMCSIWLFLQDH